MNELVLMAHVSFGVACLLTTVWVFVDVMNVSASNQARIQKMSSAAAAFMWLAFLIAGCGGRFAQANGGRGIKMSADHLIRTLALGVVTGGLLILGFYLIGD